MSLFHDFQSSLGRLRKSHLGIALILVVLLIIWMLSGTFLRAQTEVPEQQEEQPTDTAYKVETKTLYAEAYSPLQIVQGQLEPLRAVDIRSQINAHLSKRTADWGARVVSGALLFQLDPETRAAELERAQADLVLREAELRAGESLFKKDLLSETEFLRLKAAVASAKAERELNALHLNYATIHAPFDGIVDRLPIEEGDYVQVGQTLATLVDVSVLRMVAYVPQQEIYALRPGFDVEARLLDGDILKGKLTFVASLAETSTRSFRVEARIDNPEMKRIAGSSATLTIRLPELQAHRLSPALLVLGDDGQLGVKAVDAQQHVAFLPLKILSFDPQGVWVDGLPDGAEIITLGAGFVAVGDAVNPVAQVESGDSVRAEQR